MKNEMIRRYPKKESGAGLSRRDLLKTAGAIGGVMLTQKVMAAMPGPAEKILSGVIEMHVHTSPDITPRSVNDFDLVQKAREMDMRAVVIKNHEFITNDRAYLVKQVIPGIEVFGGITLNEPVGGINPAAVETMLKFSGGCGEYVWLPTRDSAFQRSFDKKSGGIRALDSSGKVLPEVRKVLKLIAGADVILGTGHISAAESLAVVKAAREEGVRKIVVTHAMQTPIEMSIEDMKKCVALGAIIEHCYLSYLMGPMSPLPAYRVNRKHVSMEDFARAIKEVGAERCLLSTDLGQSLTPTPAEGMKDFIRQLVKRGISEEQINWMVRKNPARLLGLEPF